MVGKCFTVAAVIACIVHPVTGAGAAAEDGSVTFSLGAETGYLSGSTVYRLTIPSPQGLLESRLDWPLDSWIAGINASFEKQDVWSFGLSFRTNLTQDTGLMEDSDWIEGIKFIFSESDTTMDSFAAVILDATGRYTLLRSPPWSLGAVAGFVYEHFDFTASELRQVSPLGLPGIDAAVSGPVVTYEVFYAVPYAGLGLGLKPFPFLVLSAEVLFGYAFAADEDDHLLRFKLSKARTEGAAIMMRAGGSWAITPSWSLSATVEYLTLSTRGGQDQVFYAGPDAGAGFVGIDDDVDSDQLSVLAGASFRF